MAKGRKTGGSDFQPGNKLGKGRPPVPEDLRKAKQLNQVELDRIINEYLWLDRGAIQERIKNPATPMMEIIMASIVAQAAQKGDQQRLEFILQRIIGKVKDQVELTVVEPFVIDWGDGSKTEIGVKKKEGEG